MLTTLPTVIGIVIVLTTKENRLTFQGKYSGVEAKTTDLPDLEALTMIPSMLKRALILPANLVEVETK
jgi:hypothetical protein